MGTLIQHFRWATLTLVIALTAVFQLHHRCTSKLSCASPNQNARHHIETPERVSSIAHPASKQDLLLLPPPPNLTRALHVSLDSFEMRHRPDQEDARRRRQSDDTTNTARGSDPRPGRVCVYRNTTPPPFLPNGSAPQWQRRRKSRSSPRWQHYRALRAVPSRGSGKQMVPKA